MIAELLRITAEVARLEYERELLCQQRDALLDGLWGKGAPAPEELPQVGEGDIVGIRPARVLVDGTIVPRAVGLIRYRAEDAVTDAAGNVTRWPAADSHKGEPPYAGEPQRPGVDLASEEAERRHRAANDKFAAMMDESAFKVMAGIREPAAEGLLKSQDTPAETAPEAARVLDRFMPPPEDEATRKQLDAGWARVMDWRNANPFGSPPAEEGAE